MSSIQPWKKKNGKTRRIFSVLVGGIFNFELSTTKEAGEGEVRSGRAFSSCLQVSSEDHDNDRKTSPRPYAANFRSKTPPKLGEIRRRMTVLKVSLTALNADFRILSRLSLTGSKCRSKTAQDVNWFVKISSRETGTYRFSEVTVQNNFVREVTKT